MNGALEKGPQLAKNAAEARSMNHTSSLLGLSASVFFALLVGCGGGKTRSLSRDIQGAGDDDSQSSGVQADGTYASPAGCAQTQCDVDFNACLGNNTRQCEACNNECDVDDAVECEETCEEICGNAGSADECAQTAVDCRQTPANQRCADDAGSPMPAFDPKATTDPLTAPSDDAGVPSKDDAASGTFNNEPTVCSPHAPGAFTSPVAPTTSPTSCSEDEVSNVAAACAGTVIDTAFCLSRVRAMSTTCHMCLLTQENAAKPGPLLFDPVGNIYLNQGGCITILNPSCGSSVTDFITCTAHACTSCGDPTCENDLSQCETYVPDASCFGQGAPGIAICSPDSEFSDPYDVQRFLAQFCGT